MTIRDIFEHLPEPYRTQALVNQRNLGWENQVYHGDITNTKELILWALWCGFPWNGTPEYESDTGYWSHLRDKYKDGEMIFSISKYPIVKTKFLEGYKLN